MRHITPCSCKRPVATFFPVIEGGQQSTPPLLEPSPSQDEPRSPQQQQQQHLQLQGTSFAGKHILVVDDNETNRKTVQRILEPTGCQVSQCCDGQACLEFLKKTHVDLILMDCQMPVMDGFQATREIRKGEEEERMKRQGDAIRRTPEMSISSRRPVPILAFTSSGCKEQCLDAGMNDYLVKVRSVKNLWNDVFQNFIYSEFNLFYFSFFFFHHSQSTSWLC